MEQICYMIVVAVAAVLLVVGFMDMFSHKPGEGKDKVDIISKQLRGLAFILAAQVVLVVGMAVCHVALGGKTGLSGF